MRRILLLIFLSLLPQFASSQTNYSYQANYNFYPASPGALRFGLNGVDNPALLTYVKEPDIYFIWSNGNKNYFNLNDYGLFAAFKNFGFSFYTQKFSPAGNIKNYRISFATGNKSTSFGFAYQWIKEDVPNLDFNNLITLSTLVRPNKFVSCGLIGTTTTNAKDFETAIDLAIRPFGNEKITLFGDYVYSNISNQKNQNWSSGVVIEPFSGIQLIGRYFKTKSFSIGFQISFGNISFLQSASFDKNTNRLNQTQGVRFGSYDRNIISTLIKKEKTHQIDLNGQIKYQKFQFFDKSKTLFELLDRLEKIKSDNSIKEIEINTSGMITPSVFLWEIRDKLLELKNCGKRITIYVDNVDLEHYHLASVANKIIMDPEGLIFLNGVLMGRNYYKHTLEKLGIGFDELRFFKYKSAAETYARDKMSDADREQRQLIVDNLFNTIKNDIESSRMNLKYPLDSLVNNYAIFDSKKALQFGLIDSIGRWYDIKEKTDISDILKIVRDNSIEADKLNEDNYWSEKPKIAILYALGACAMDDGIRARSLIKDIEKISKDNSIKAVVFRIDSPGGDPLASDIVAEGIKKLKKIKPVIVSQGIVAGSGGYWLSMYGDTIVSNKNTITGSIGVIASWFYNKGLKENLGVSTDLVKKGEHSDLAYGMIIPILNTVLPDRKLSTEERLKVEEMIKTMYQKFVQKVANGRNKSVEEIEKVAQGRVWSGSDAINLGLVDVLGGLDTAIEIARKKANLKKDEYKIVEFPKPQMFDIGAVLPISLSSQLVKNPSIDFLKFNLINNGKPLLMMPYEFIPEEILVNDFYH